MIQKIFNLPELNVVITQALPIQVVFIHEDSPKCNDTLKMAVKRIENNYQNTSINFYSADTSSRKVHPLVELYHLKVIPSILFFENGKLKYKMEGDISKIKFMEIIQKLVNDYKLVKSMTLIKDAVKHEIS